MTAQTLDELMNGRDELRTGECRVERMVVEFGKNGKREYYRIERRDETVRLAPDVRIDFQNAGEIDILFNPLVPMPGRLDPPAPLAGEMPDYTDARQNDLTPKRDWRITPTDADLLSWPWSAKRPLWRREFPFAPVRRPGIGGKTDDRRTGRGAGRGAFIQG
ncbi:MAG: hypothetical protein M1457_11995 [bacterium]|nr:hypothetical protein [bacterium]